MKNKNALHLLVLFFGRQCQGLASLICLIFLGLKHVCAKLSSPPGSTEPAWRLELGVVVYNTRTGEVEAGG